MKNLTNLNINFARIRRYGRPSLPNKIQMITPYSIPSLTSLKITNMNKVNSLSRKFMKLASLTHLTIVIDPYRSDKSLPTGRNEYLYIIGQMLNLID